MDESMAAIVQALMLDEYPSLPTEKYHTEDNTWAIYLPKVYPHKAIRSMEAWDNYKNSHLRELEKFK